MSVINTKSLLSLAGRFTAGVRDQEWSAKRRVCWHLNLIVTLAPKFGRKC